MTNDPRLDDAYFIIELNYGEYALVCGVAALLFLVWYTWWRKRPRS